MKGRSLFQRMTSNALWLWMGQLVRGGGAFIIGILIARYFGPHEFGVFSYSMGVVLLLTPFATLGLNSIVIAAIVNEPENKATLLGTAFLLRVLGGICVYAIAIITAMATAPPGSQIVLLVSIIALFPIIQAAEVIDLDFQSDLRSARTVSCRLTAASVAFISRFICIALGAPLTAFAATVVLEYALTSTCLVFKFRRQGGEISSWRFSREQAFVLMRDGWPLLLSVLSIAIYSRIDQIMLQRMRGSTDVGIFSAAVRVSDFFIIFPSVIGQTIYPVFRRVFTQSRILYDQYLRASMGMAFWCSLSFCIAVMLLSHRIILTTYGARYVQSAPVLAVYVFTTISISMGIIFSSKYVFENMTQISLYGTIAGAISSVLLNLLLIPRYGPVGAAVSAAISHFVPTLVIGLFFKPRILLFYLRSIWSFGDMRKVISSVRASHMPVNGHGG